jgi:hypothetical protein
VGTGVAGTRVERAGTKAELIRDSSLTRLLDARKMPVIPAR